ncbi:MAG TPA: rod shape-determining protein RodA [Nocardioidaceae bacterium]|nr:rod shape-determining protein RodA [Nocardioidaceae bacterium]
MVATLPVRSSRRQAPLGSRRAPALWRQLDWLLVASVLALLAVGMILVWSATLHRDDLTGGDTNAYLRKQGVNAAIGLVLAAVVAATDYRWLRLWAPVVYLASILGLILIFVPGVGATINGSHSWLLVGGLSLQPAELAKFGVVLGMALVLAERTEAHLRQGVNSIDVVPALLIAAVPAVLILAQPDLGTLMVLTATVFGVVALSGAPKRWLLMLLAGGAALIYGAVRTGLLESYQLLRFEAFTDPSLDPRGAGYNTIQARIAIGNGGVTGQGLFDGTQTQSGFVPEQHTDFVFTVAGEELGLVGATVLVGLFALLLWRALRIALRADDLFGRVAAAGVACWFGFQTFQNIGMCLGIMPVTGVPLPLVSYGGTSMFASLTAVGLLLNVHLRTQGRAGSGVVVRSRFARSRF